MIPRAHSAFALATAFFPLTAEPGEPAGASFAGTIVVAREDGALGTPRAGTVELWTSLRGKQRAVAAVRDGRFEARTQGQGTYIDVGRIELDGVAYWAVGPWGHVEAPRAAELVARPVKPAWIRLVDARTGADLARARFELDDGGWPRRPVEESALPYAVPHFHDGESGLSGWIGLRPYVVRAPGYAVQRLWVDPSEGGTRTFPLEPEARVSVTVAGTRTGAAAGAADAGAVAHAPYAARRVTVRAHGTAADRARLTLDELSPGADGTVVVDGLSGGAWTLELWDRTMAGGVANTSDGQGVLLDRRTLAVRPGETHAITLRSGESAAAERGADTGLHELRGTLHIAGAAAAGTGALVLEHGWPGSGDARVQVVLERALWTADPDVAGLWHWHAGARAPGRWRASLAGTAWTQEFELAPGAFVELVAHLAGPAREPAAATSTLRWRFVDGADGRPLGQAEARARLHGGDPAAWHADELAWSAPVAGTELDVGVESASWGPRSRGVRARVDGGIVDVPLLPARVIEIRAREDGARLGAPELRASLGPVLEPVGHAGEPGWDTATQLRVNEYLWVVYGDGRWRITPGTDGPWLPHPPVEVEVRAGEPPPVAEFGLTRRPRGP